MNEQDWTPDMFYTYRFTKNDNSDTVTLVIPVDSEWSEEEIFEVAMYDLGDHLGTDIEDAKENWWENLSWLSTAEDMEAMGGVYSHLRNEGA